MSDPKEYKKPEGETESAGKIAGAQETAISDLRGHQAAELETGNTGKIVGAVMVALMIGAAGAYAYGTGMWDAPPKQVVAFNTAPPATLPPSIAPPQQPAVPPHALDMNAPLQAAPAPPVRSTRTHVQARAIRHSSTVQPPENFSGQGSPAPVAPVESVPQQPAPPDAAIVPPPITPLPDAATQPAPQ